MNEPPDKPESEADRIEAERVVHESTMDLSKMTAPEHHWVDRGLKMSCEGAGHPNHQAWKRPMAQKK